MPWLLAALLVAVEALTTYAAPSSGCSGDCMIIPTKEYVEMKVALINSEHDFAKCANKLSQNQAANRYALPDR